MTKTLKSYLLFLIALLGLIIYVEITRPKPIDWSPTYNQNDKRPLGLYVFKNELPHLFKEKSINEIYKSPYEFLVEKNFYDEEKDSSYYQEIGLLLYIDEYNQFDNESVYQILDFVSAGNNAFFSSKNFPETLLDSLKLKVNFDYIYNDTLTTYVSYKNKKSKKISLLKNANNNYFDIDSASVEKLGYQTIRDSLFTNFIKVPYGKGSFYLHSQPVVFTNYNLLKDKNFTYTESILSFLPNEDIFWLLPKTRSEELSNNPLRVIFKNPSLKWAWYLFLIGTLIFIFFHAKRRQRIIPIITPLQNTTLDFAKTIGNLYFQEKNHSTIIEKKIIYFLEKVRTDYLIDTTQLNEEFVKKLHLKSGKKIEDIEELVALIKNFKNAITPSTENDLIKINNSIEKLLDNEYTRRKQSRT